MSVAIRVTNVWKCDGCKSVEEQSFWTCEGNLLPRVELPAGWVRVTRDYPKEYCAKCAGEVKTP